MFTTTNLEIAIRCCVRGKVETEGEATVPSKLFFDFVSLLPNENVQMELHGEALGVACGKYKTKVNGLPASDFPLVPSVKGVWSCLVPADALRRSLSRVLFASATNESRPELTGVCFQFERTDRGSVLTLAATDSYRLAEDKILLDGAPTGPARTTIVPARTLVEIGRILSVFHDSVDVPSQVRMEVSESQVVFSFGTVELISRLIEGTYPDYRQIIPKQFPSVCTLDREDFIKAMKAASLFSKTGLFDVTLHLDDAGQHVKVSGADSARGEHTAVCAARLEGPDNTVTVNYRYVLDGLSAIDAEEVVFRMIDASNPCLLTSKNTEDGYLYVVMPIKQ